MSDEQRLSQYHDHVPPEFHPAPNLTCRHHHPHLSPHHAQTVFAPQTGIRAQHSDLCNSTSSLGYGKLYTSPSQPSLTTAFAKATRPGLEVINFGPCSYVPGIQYDLQVRSSFDFFAQSCQINVVFGTHASRAHVNFQGRVGCSFIYLISCVSPWVNDNWGGPITVDLEIILPPSYQPLSQLSGAALQRTPEVPRDSGPLMTSNDCRKRRLSNPIFSPQRSAKAACPQQLRSHPEASAVESHESSLNLTTHVHGGQGLLDYGPSYFPQHKFFSSTSTDKQPFSAPRSSPSERFSAAAIPPGLSTEATNAFLFNRNSHNLDPTQLESPSSNHCSMPITHSPSNMPLVRISTIKLHEQRLDLQGDGHFSTFERKKPAELRLDGDLEDMAKNWSIGELQERRRLVRFKRSTSDSIVMASFEPATADLNNNAGVCVSCILWKEKDEKYITSVDALSLLEHLVGFHLKVEEKNRIRRNLEGFKPITISKSKEAKVAVSADVEKLFKVIMSFDDPKPRNIEKDLKVFPWKVLTKALQKIVSKFTPDYSSASHLLESGASIEGGRRSEGVSYAMFISPTPSSQLGDESLPAPEASQPPSAEPKSQRGSVCPSSYRQAGRIRVPRPMTQGFDHSRYRPKPRADERSMQPSQPLLEDDSSVRIAMPSLPYLAQQAQSSYESDPKLSQAIHQG